MSVVLPLPDSPTTPSVRPRRTTMLTSARAWTRPPRGAAYVLVTSRASSTRSWSGAGPVVAAHAATATSLLMHRTLT